MLTHNLKGYRGETTSELPLFPDEDRRRWGLKIGGTRVEAAAVTSSSSH